MWCHHVIFVFRLMQYNYYVLIRVLVALTRIYRLRFAMNWSRVDHQTIIRIQPLRICWLWFVFYI